MSIVWFNRVQAINHVGTKNIDHDHNQSQYHWVRVHHGLQSIRINLTITEVRFWFYQQSQPTKSIEEIRAIETHILDSAQYPLFC